MHRLWYIMLLFLPLSCRQMVDAVNMKQISPEVVNGGTRPGNWYTYLPEYAPRFCLRTTHSLSWHDAEMKLGYWRLLHPLAPHRIVMEARGDTLYLHRGFVWDGVSFGRTEASELVPSLLHDALYYARQADAPVSRREADAVYLRACRRTGCSGRYAGYLAVRTFGGFFGKPEGALVPILQPTSEDTPMASPPAGENGFILLQP